MSELKFFFGGEDTGYQHDSVPMLARCFEEWRIFQEQNGNRFSFREISFVAADGDKIVGHVGIMPFDIYDANGNIIRMAGIASVGTDPDYRGRGIAARLCNDAADWAKENNFDIMPLYTSFNRVYESCSWKNYPMQSVILSNRSVKKTQLKKGIELTDDEKKFISDCYNKIPPFAGKVIRTEDISFHGWKRVFRDSFEWLVTDNGYACAFEGFLCEFYAVDGNGADLCAGFEKAFLSAKYPQAGTLLDAGWQITSLNVDPECWHGENVMLRNLGTDIQSDIFFSLTDKF